MSFRNHTSDRLKKTTPQNKTLLQGFEWHSARDGKHFNRLREALPAYKYLGVSSLWLPPACKAYSQDVSLSLNLVSRLVSH